jgi:hypothetical protein
MSILIVSCILAIIAIFAYIALSKAECSQDTDCKPSYKCQSGKCTPSGTVTPPPGNYIVCNSDNCPLPNTCQNNQCVSECSPTNCISPKICDENKKCITPICTPGQLAKLFPDGPINYSCLRRYFAGECVGINDKYLAFRNTDILLPDSLMISNYESVLNLSKDECESKCDLDPNCTIWNYNPSNENSKGCQTIKQPIVPLVQNLHAMQNQDPVNKGCYGFFYNDNDDWYSLPTRVKISALE